MQTLTISPNLEVTLYDSIEEFPVHIELEARQYATMQSGLATSQEELEEKKERIDLLERYDRKGDLYKEQSNYRIAEHLLSINFMPLELEWCCYVYAINGGRVVGHRENALIERLDHLKENGLTSNQIAESLNQLKAEMEAEVKRLYPGRIEKGKKWNNLTRYKAYGEAMVDHFIDPNEETKRKLDKAIIDILSTQEVLDFGGENDVLSQLKTAQFAMYAILTECGVADPKSITLFEYYGWIDVLQKRHEAQKPTPTPHAPKRQ
ncbi:type I phosphoribosyltransferase [Spirosoma radiotolerans]|uniref:Uncharacterized protein n=1 Tax=Spirosoma radiotolerans TaxID=1379870 RepID=A0A0E3V6H7_9BACT|nr:hypothetical protein [Spirosoma radiotolerans]AKD55032.1 hypothetical protein SD10_09070 [Spirosoma radiotolerans]